MGMMKVLAVLFVVAVYSSEAAIKCYQGKQGAEKLADCAGDKAGETKCSGPKFTEYTGLAADVEYACGSCTAETEGKTCTSTDAEKNKVETADAFKCKSWEYKTDKWVVATAVSTCSDSRTLRSPATCPELTPP